MTFILFQDYIWKLDQLSTFCWKYSQLWTGLSQLVFFNTIKHFNYLNYPYTFNRRSLKSLKEGTFFINCCKSCRELIWIEEWVWCRGCGGGGGGISCYDKLLWNIYEVNWNKVTKIQKIRWSYLLQTSK